MSQIPDVADHAATSTPFIKRARKFLVSACGVAAMVLSTGVLEENVEIYVNTALAVATALGVYQARNAPTV